MFYLIYKTTNTINGKFYIGKHKTKRLDDGYMGSGKILKHAISKYGIENFHKEILHVCKDETHMNLLEKILVVPDIEINYNLCPGGRGGFGYINEYLEDQSFRSKAGSSMWSKHRKKLLLSSAKGGRSVQKTHRETILKNLEKGQRLRGQTHTDEWKLNHSNLMKEKQKGHLNSQFGTMWITNGVENKKIKKDVDIIPDGWYKGRTK